MIMIARTVLQTILCLLLSTGFAVAHDVNMKGPNGGKVLAKVHPHAEVFITKDRRVQITFLTNKGKAASLNGQTVKGICGQRKSAVRLSFAAKGKSLISDKPIPAGKRIPAVLEFKMSPKGKAVFVRTHLEPGK